MQCLQAGILSHSSKASLEQDRLAACESRPLESRARQRPTFQAIIRAYAHARYFHACNQVYCCCFSLITVSELRFYQCVCHSNYCCEIASGRRTIVDWYLLLIVAAPLSAAWLEYGKKLMEYSTVLTALASGSASLVLPPIVVVRHHVL